MSYDVDISNLIAEQFDDNVVGVYELFLDGELVYVGQSTELPNRILTHLKSGGVNFDSFDVTFCNEDELNDIEATYIIERQPKKNKSVPPNAVYVSEASINKQIYDYIKSKIEGLDTVYTTNLGKTSRSRYVKRPSQDYIRQIVSDFEYSDDGYSVKYTVD